MRNSAYGGGEIGTVGRGANSSTVTIHKPGVAHLYMYKGKVFQDVFGGGRGFDNLNRMSALGTGGYVFGKTDVNIYGGEIGTTAGVADGYGNVFGGGNLGYVYSGNGKKAEQGDTGLKSTSTLGYYYEYDKTNSTFTGSSANTLTEDCRVIVAPACQVLCGEDITLNGHSYTAGQYVPAEDLNFLQNKNSDGDRWDKLNVDGVIIRNAVFAGSWVTDAKRHFSRTNSATKRHSDGYISKNFLTNLFTHMQQIVKIEHPTIGQNFGSVTIINNYPQPVADPKQEDKVSNTPSAIPPDFFCVSARFSEENIRERLAAELSQATSKIDYCRSLYRLQHIGCINIQQYASDAQRAIVFNRFQSRFTLSASDFCKARMTK